MIKALLFAIVLAELGGVPMPYGVATYREAQRAGVDPVDLAGMLLAENRARTYDPAQVGRYGKGGEAGLFQLAPDMWAPFCGVSRAALFEAGPNIRCAAQVIAELQDHHRRRCRHAWPHDWRAHWRCSNRTLYTRRCGWSVKRAQKQTRRVRSSWEQAQRRPWW